MRSNQSLQIPSWVFRCFLAFPIIYVGQVGIAGCSRTPSQSVSATEAAASAKKVAAVTPPAASPTSDTCLETKPRKPPTKLPKHVFLIVLENEGYNKTFGDPSSPLAQLVAQHPNDGRLLTNYYAIWHNSFVNYIAMISGQRPTPYSSSFDCLKFKPLVHYAPIGADGLVNGKADGCVYPKEVPTIANQLEDTQRTWRAYMEDMQIAYEHPSLGMPNHSEAGTCRYPDTTDEDSDDGPLDCTNQARQYGKKGKGAVFDQYTTRHNPFVYFLSITGNQRTCTGNDLPMTSLYGDINGSQAPSLLFITPNLCHDGHDGADESIAEARGFTQAKADLIADAKRGVKNALGIVLQAECNYKYPTLHAEKCVDGMPGGLQGIKRFLLGSGTEPGWVEKIMQSNAYKDDGMIIITFDEAKNTSDYQGVSYDSLGNPRVAEGVGGGKVGALVISKLVKPRKDDTPYNHYALLHSIEDLFGLKPLGSACHSSAFSNAPDGFYK